MTLKQRAFEEVERLSEDDLEEVIRFMGFLRFSAAEEAEKKKAMQSETVKYRERGGLSGEVILADDFHDTPECFGEYL